MSALSKVFVVLVTIFSVGIVTLLVPYVTNRENYRETIKQLEQAKTSAEVTAMLRQKEIASLLDKESERVSELTAGTRQLAQKNIDLAAAKADAEAKSREAEAQRVQAEDRASTVAAANKQLSDILKSVQDELVARQQNMIKMQTQLIELGDRNEELLAQVETLSRNVRHLKEDLADRSTSIAEMEGWLKKLDPVTLAYVKGESADTTPFLASTLIQGHVTRVEKVGGDNFVQIDIGRAHNVKQNMKFLVHRGDDYLGSLVITFVDEQSAAGQLQLAKVGTSVASGDEVFSGKRIQR